MRFFFLAVLTVGLSVLGCGPSAEQVAETARKRDIDTQRIKEQTIESKRQNEMSHLMKGGKLETKELPRGKTEVIATVQPSDLDKAMACLGAQKIDANTTKEGDLVDIVVKREDSEKAAKALQADAEDKGYNVHAGASAAIKPGF